MSCRGCPEPQDVQAEHTRSDLYTAPRVGIPEARTGAAQSAILPLDVLLAGTILLPAGEPDLLLRVDVARLKAGLPPVVVLTGPGYARAYTAQQVRLMGPSILGRVEQADFSVALRTTAAVEVLA